MRGTLIGIHREIQGPSKLVVLTADFTQEDNEWTAVCLELGTAASAETLAQARAEVQEAIALQLNEVERLGFIDDYLKEHNVSTINLPRDLTSPPSTDKWDLLPAGA